METRSGRSVVGRRAKRAVVCTAALLGVLLGCGPTSKVDDAADDSTPRTVVRVLGDAANLVHVSVTRRPTGPGGGATTETPLEITAGGTATLLLPVGVTSILHAASEEALVWPATVWPEPGAEVVLHTRRHRSVTVCVPAGIGAGDEVRISVIPDRDSIPLTDPQQTDALEQAAATGASFAAGKGPSVAVPHLLPMSYHVLASAGRRCAYGHFDESATTVDLGADWTSRTIAGAPRLGGETAAPGTLVAPGRLDMVAVAGLSRPIFASFAGAFHVCGPAPEAAFELPRSEWVTVWHPEVGLAHVRPPADGRIDAPAGPGEVVFVAPKGQTLTGSATVWSFRRGTGAVFTLPQAFGLQRTFDGVTRARVRGLWPGDYRFVWSFRCSASGTVSDRGEVRITADAPSAEVAVRARD